jgi:hypothetical protein
VFGFFSKSGDRAAGSTQPAESNSRVLLPSELTPVSSAKFGNTECSRDRRSKHDCGGEVCHAREGLFQRALARPELHYAQRHLRPSNINPLRGQLEVQLQTLMGVNERSTLLPPMVHRPSA